MKIFLCVPCIFILCGGASTLSAQVQSSVTLTWQDNSNNEEGFGIEMLSPRGLDFTEIATVGPNISQYRLTLRGDYGDMFCFRVFAFNATADSPDSNIACKTASRGPSLAAGERAEHPRRTAPTLFPRDRSVLHGKTSRMKPSTFLNVD